MNRASTSAFTLAALFSVSAFATVGTNSNTGSTDTTSTAKSPTVRPVSISWHRLLTLELIGGSNSISDNQITTDSSGGTTTSRSDSGSMSGSSAINGIAAGMTQKVGTQFGIEGNLAFVAKKFDSSESGGEHTSSMGKASTKFYATRITGMGRYYPANGFSLGAGLYASTFIGPAHITSEEGQSTSESISETFFNRIDTGAVVGARGEIPLSSDVDFILDARYFHGLRNLLDEDKIREVFGVTADQLQASAYTRDFQFGAGVGFKF